MFGPAKFATESVRRTQQLYFPEQFSRLMKMQDSKSGCPSTMEVYPHCFPPPRGSTRILDTQPDGIPVISQFGQELGLPRSSFLQPTFSGRNQYSSLSNTQTSGSLQPVWQSTGYPLPPTFSRSYHATFPSLASSTGSSSVCQKNSSTDVEVGIQSRTLDEQSQTKRALHVSGSSVDCKKLCSESRGSSPNHQQTSTVSQLQMGNPDIKNLPSRSENGSTSAGAPSPDMARFKRRWRSTAIGRKHRCHHESDMEVSVLCYNVLAQCLIESNSYLYEHCPWDILKWDYRKKNLLRELSEADTDIICLQEVQACHFRDFFSPELEKLGYAALYQQRTGDKHDGCAIFYKKDKFELEDSKRVRYYRSNIQLLDRDNVAIIALLHPTGLDDALKLCVATTHLLYNPKRGDIKLAQLGMLLAEIDHMAMVGPASSHQTPVYHPIILCGDFNSLPHSPLYSFIRNRRLDYVGLQKVTVSGQGSNRRSLNPLNWPLWPYDVGVTDACQFRSVVRERLRECENKQENHEQCSETSNATNLPPDWENRFSESIHHPFPLNSVHRHEGAVHEVTTNHSKTNCTVDYIFFSGSPQANIEGAAARTKVGELKLLGYRSLLTDEEATDMGGLPNHSLSSDHFSLKAMFLLTLPE